MQEGETPEEHMNLLPACCNQPEDFIRKGLEYRKGTAKKMSVEPGDTLL
jgi:hypothetical protein